MWRIPWKIFTNGDQNDIMFSKYIIDQITELDQPYENYMAPMPTKPEELVSMLSCFKGIISFRLHSHIIAASLQIPSVALVWDNKLRFFFKKLGYDNRCFTVEETPEFIYKQMERVLEEGIDETLLEEQKRQAENLLLTAMKEYMER